MVGFQAFWVGITVGVTVALGEGPVLLQVN